MLGNPGGPAMIPKKGNFAAVFSQNQMYQFTGEGVFSKKTNFSLGLLLQSGLEIKIGKYINIDDLSISMQGIAYHIKKKKFGLGLHLTTYKHNMDDYYEGKAKETGISIHKRFKKKDLKPFIYYSRILLKPKPDMVEPYSLKHKEEYLSFGIMTEIKHFVLGTYITTQIEDLMNLNKESGQLSITLGALLY